MKAHIQVMDQIKGFLPKTYVVWNDKQVVKICTSMKEAKEIVSNLNK